MLPSASNNLRPDSRASQRPVSSLSHYQSGSTQNISARPASSASIRPISQTSHRPKSRQQRVTSAKLLPLCAQLVKSILNEGKEEDELVESTDDTPRETLYTNYVDYALKALGVDGSIKAAVTLDMESVEKMICGHAEKARIKTSETLATALEDSFKKLKDISEKGHDLDSEIKKSVLPNHVQFLLALSSPPTPSTLAYASLLLNEPENPIATMESDTLTWKKFLEEDPFEGEHWIGVPGGIPLPGKKMRHDGDDDLGDSDLDSSPSLSTLDSDERDLELDDTDSERSPSPRLETEPPSLLLGPNSINGEISLHETHAYRTEVESLKKRQYWREDWRMDPDVAVQTRGSFDIGDASTLGPTLQRVLRQNESSPVSSSSPSLDSLPLELLVASERYIYEQDAVREVLMALQGRENIMLEFKAGQYMPAKNTPRLLHLSLAAQQSILCSFCRTCTTLQKLRSFVAFVVHHSTEMSSTLSSARLRTSGKMTHTLEAFADAIDSEIRSLDSWCALREEAWLRALGGGLDELDDNEIIAGDPGLVVSLLATEKAFRDQFEDSFQILLDVVHKIVLESESGIWTIPVRSPSVTTALLLDTLFFSIQQRLERGDAVTADVVTRVFARSAEPVWKMVGKWLGKGFDLNGERLDEEFFIESNGIGPEIGVLGLLDPDFWADGFDLRDGEPGTLSPDGVNEQSQNSVPSFLQHVAVPILQSGKAVGLLKALDKDVGEGSEISIFRNWDWGTFQQLFTSEVSKHTIGTVSSPDELVAQDAGSLFSVSIDRLERLVYEKVEPYLVAAGSFLADVVVEECDFWFHLNVMEGLFLMRKGDVISDFVDVLFSKMDARQNWSDFHFLNTAFSDVVEPSNNISGGKPWIQLPLVRLFYRGDTLKEQSIARTVMAIDGLFVEYAVPFPLTYIFTRQNLQIYDEIFGFLLQIRRAKNVLEKTLVKGEDRKARSGAGLKAFYAMRSRLSWFINTLLNFLTTYVVHTQVINFHDILKAANSPSFDQMIDLHDEHLRKMQERCLLQSRTASLHRAILSVLDMSISLSNVFAALIGNANMTRETLSRSLALKQHRSRRQKRRRRNVVGFSQSITWATESSDSEDEVDIDGLGLRGDESNYDGGAFSFSALMGGSEAGDVDPFGHLNKISTELDGLVKFVRRDVETLAGGTGEAASVFGVLAFLLEDWDLF